MAQFGDNGPFDYQFSDVPPVMRQQQAGTQGPPGPQGPQGPAGPGVAAGGSTGQFLKKTSSSDYATGWGDAEGS